MRVRDAQVVVELRAGSAAEADIRRATVHSSSSSFANAFGRAADDRPGMLFELIDAEDECARRRVEPSPN